VTEPKDIVRRFLETPRLPDGSPDMAMVEECFAADYWSHTWQGDLAHTAARQGRFLACFEPVETIDSDLIAEGDLVVHRSRRRLRHIGDALGVPATDREVTVDHIDMWRVTNGKIVEHWGGIGVAGQLHRDLTIGG